MILWCLLWLSIKVDTVFCQASSRLAKSLGKAEDHAVIYFEYLLAKPAVHKKLIFARHYTLINAQPYILICAQHKNLKNDRC